MKTFTCEACQKKMMLPLQSKTIWSKAGEALIFAISTHPENLPDSEPVPMCAPCVIKILSGILTMEGEELGQVFSV